MQRVATFGAITRGAATIYNGKLFRITIDNHLRRARHEDRQGAVEPAVRRLQGRLHGHRRADRGQRRRDLRDGRRRIHHARLPRRVGSGHRQEIVASLHDSRTGRTWVGNLAEGQRRVGARRRRHLAVRLVRSASSISSTGARATPSRTTRDRAARSTACTRRASWPFGRRPARSPATSSTRPNDVYDVDGVDEHVLADIQIDGRPRKVMIQANKNGFLYVLDRTNCKLIAAHPYTTVNWATHVDLATGRPVLTDLYKRFLAGEEVRDLSAARDERGADRVQPEDRARLHEHVGHAAHPENRAAQAAGDRDQLHRRRRQSCRRSSRATSSDTSSRSIRSPARRSGKCRSTDMPSSAGMLVTDGGLVFTGKLTGEFVALDEDTGADAVAVQDRLERQRDGDHLHAQRTAVRDGGLRARRRVWRGVLRRRVCRPADRCGRSR